MMGDWTPLLRNREGLSQGHTNPANPGRASSCINDKRWKNTLKQGEFILHE